MKRRNHKHTATVTAFDALTIEGALIAPAMLTRIAAHQGGEQTEADYGVPKGLTLRDEISRYFRIGQALFDGLAASDHPSVGATIKFVEDLLRDVFGFADLRSAGPRIIDDRQFIVTLEGLGQRVPIIVVAPADDLDRPSDHLPGDGRRRSAASAIQDWLNADEQSLWGLCSNGFRLRLVRDNASLTRPAYIETNLRAIFEEQNFADFAVLWLLIHASRFGRSGTPPSDCVLERWRESGQKEGVVARERLGDGVETALLSLGNGFLSQAENSALRERLQNGALSLREFFGQLLRFVYRLIFLLAAEDRSLLHPPEVGAVARRLYASGYSVSALRDRAVRRSSWDHHSDLWEGLLITFTALTRGEKRLGLPALDGLFAPGTLPDLEAAKLGNRALMEAIYRLAWLKDDSGIVPVNWRDMETEELGSVYEGLLELTPQLNGGGRQFQFAEGAEAKGHSRKKTGSYYTPDSLVQALLDSALDPVLDRVEAEADDPTSALLSVTVLDPACGSGHFLLAAARRIATRLARARTDGLASPDDYRHALRDVVRACMHGVDRNPMAVELTKVALWVESVDPGKPLGFLDTNIRCGDSLFGIFDVKSVVEGIPDGAYKPLAGDDKETAKHFEKRNKAERDGQGSFDFAAGGGRLPSTAPLVNEANAVRAMPENSPDEILLKRKRYEAARSDSRTWNVRIAADLYVAAFLTPKTGGVPINRYVVTIPTTAHLWDALAARNVYGPLVGRAQKLTGEAAAFHWPLEFPDIIARGGFDVILGNPPWERVKLQEQEFFAARDPEIANAPNAAARQRLIAKLKQAGANTRERALYDEFEAAKRAAEASSVFARIAPEDGGRFPLTGRGDVNTYALFAELFLRLTGKRGRAGLITPTGIATDVTTARFFAQCVESGRIVSLFDFRNDKGLFPSVAALMRFCILTFSGAGGGNAARYASLLQSTTDISDEQRNYRLTRDQIARINPNTKTAPVFRSRSDAELSAKIYAHLPVLVDETKGKAGNPWRAKFHTRLWHMAEDSEWFRTAAQLREAGFVRWGTDWIAAPLSGQAEGLSLRKQSDSEDSLHPHKRYVPLYEAKMLGIYDHRFGSYPDGHIDDTRALPRLSLDQLADPGFETSPRYWVPDREVTDRLAANGWKRDWLMGWRKITNTNNERSLIPSVFPKAAAGDSVPLCLPDIEGILATCLLSGLCSLVVDYCERQKLGGTNLTFQYLFQLPVLPPTSYSSDDVAFIVPRVLELTYTSHSMAPFARDLGFEGAPFKWDEDRRALLRAELDAWYARAYGLTRDELRYILDPTDVKGPDYPSETFRVLKEKEIAKFGEFRTASLVLQAWDAMERGGAQCRSTKTPLVRG